MQLDLSTRVGEPRLVRDLRSHRHRTGRSRLQVIALATGAGDALGFAREVADEIWFMEAGRVVERGRPAELADAEAYPRLASFLRSIRG